MISSPQPTCRTGQRQLPEFGYSVDSHLTRVRFELDRPEAPLAAFEQALGHTAFLRGEYREALAAYKEGQRRDPQNNSRQGCRLAMVRFANGDVEDAERDLRRFIDAAPPEEREDLLLEAHDIVHALIRTEQRFADRTSFLDRIAVEMARARR